MKRRALCLILAIITSSSLNSTEAASENISGVLCKKSGSLMMSGVTLFKCLQSGKTLVWQEVIDETSSFTVFPISGPTWLELARIKEAESLAAQRERDRIAEVVKAAQAAAEKLAAEARAAKDAAEIPRIDGLTIGRRLWGDDFIGQAKSAINSKNWTARNCHRVPTSLGGGACFDSEVNYYAPSAIQLDGSQDGVAVISTSRIGSSLPTDAGSCLSVSCHFVSGRFDTHGKVAFKYGFIEARIKMPEGSGNHPAFWMLGDNINQVGWPYSGEMDVVEIHGDRPALTTSATHFSTTDSPNTCCGNHRYLVDELAVGEDVSSAFHTYAIAWLPDSISYYFDGRLVGNTTPSSLPGKWVFNEKFFLILNNAVNAGFSGSWTNLQSSFMTIDWVRSYQVNGYGEVFTS